MTDIIKFKTGHIYSTTSICNHEVVYSFCIERRTAKSGDVRADVGRWSGSLTANAEMGRVESLFPSIRPTEDYVVADATIGYAVNDSTEVYLRVDNIFDEQYQTTAGYGTSDRAFYLGLRARF